MTRTVPSIEQQLRSWSEALEHESRAPDLARLAHRDDPARRSRVLLAVAGVITIVGVAGLMLATIGRGPNEFAGSPVTPSPGTPTPTSSTSPATTAAGSVVLTPAPTIVEPHVPDEPANCTPVDRFERFRDVTLSGELAERAEIVTASLRDVPGVRAVVFSTDGTPTVIVAPDTPIPELVHEILVSCVSDDDIAAVEGAAATIASATGEPVSVGYQAFTDSIHIVTRIDNETIRAGLPEHLTDRQLTIVHDVGEMSRL